VAELMKSETGKNRYDKCGHEDQKGLGVRREFVEVPDHEKKC
jgi:hypothetical protein